MNAVELYKNVDPLKAISDLGLMFAKSGFAGCDRPEQGQTLAWICLSENKSPTEIIRTYDIIGGKLRKKAMAAFAEFRQRGGKVRWIDTGEDGAKASAEFTFEGNSVTLSFTIEQAKKGGANFKEGSNWNKTPGNMLRARVMSNAIGMLCPEIFAGSEADDETETPAAPSLSLAPDPLTKTEPKNITVEVAKPAAKAPKIVEVEEEKAEAAAGLAPVKTEAAETKVEVVAPVAGGLPEATVNELALALTGHEENAMLWFVGRGAKIAPSVILSGVSAGELSQLPGATESEKATAYIQLGNYKKEWLSHINPKSAAGVLQSLKKQNGSFLNAINPKPAV